MRLRGGTSAELVIEASTASFIRADPDLSRWTRQMPVTDRARVYRHNGEITYPTLVTDDAVHVALPRDGATGRAWTSTSDEVVADRAEATFGDHRVQAVRLTADDFPV